MPYQVQSEFGRSYRKLASCVGMQSAAAQFAKHKHGPSVILGQL
jgi:hypothetical protein